MTLKVIMTVEVIQNRNFFSCFNKRPSVLSDYCLMRDFIGLSRSEMLFKTPIFPKYPLPLWINGKDLFIILNKSTNQSHPLMNKNEFMNRSQFNIAVCKQLICDKSGILRAQFDIDFFFLFSSCKKIWCKRGGGLCVQMECM